MAQIAEKVPEVSAVVQNFNVEEQSIYALLRTVINCLVDKENELKQADQSKSEERIQVLESEKVQLKQDVELLSSLKQDFCKLVMAARSVNMGYV